MIALDSIGVPYRAVIQPQERENYSRYIPDKKLLLLPDGLDGLVPARNWIWDFAKEMGHEYFWTMDDNIQAFYRMDKNLRHKLITGDAFRAIEDFAARYQNLAICGMQYDMFLPRKQKHEVMQFNTRVYSNMLIRTVIPYRNRGVYNDDTDLCIRVLKDGWVTVLFNAFQIKKLGTMRIKGGNTPIYQGDGRLKMAQELQRAHPDVTRIVRKWGRWQHHVDYRPFKKNKLILKPGVVIPEGVNNFGMKLVHLTAPNK